MVTCLLSFFLLSISLVQALCPSHSEPKLRACWTNPALARPPSHSPHLHRQLHSFLFHELTFIHRQTKGQGWTFAHWGPPGSGSSKEVVASSVYQGDSRQGSPQSQLFWPMSCTSFSKWSCLQTVLGEQLLTSVGGLGVGSGEGEVVQAPLLSVRLVGAGWMGGRRASASTSPYCKPGWGRGSNWRGQVWV